MKKPLLLVAVCLLMTSLSFGQASPGRAKPSGIQNAPTDCSAPPVLSSDGVVTSEDFLTVSSAAYYTLNVKAGHSYSIEVWDPFDPTAQVSPAIDVLAAGCGASINPTDVSSFDPDFTGGFASRVSFVQASDATVNIQVTNPDQNNGYTYYIRVDDTTLFNPRWSTYSGYDTQWGLLNTTNKNISGTLKIFNVDGTLLKSVGVTINANQISFVIASQQSVPADHAGNAVFTFVGPPGGILADAYFLSADAKTIVPAIFASKHAYH